MENFFLYVLIALAVLAIADLVVGVSNDAVNFLNSAIGSKVISFRSIMIVASVGVAFGAIFSSGMMEVARKGIFNPELFYFDEIMFVFLAVMITDILLLDFFNTIGLPTSTTVSIVFELLGAALAMSYIKIVKSGAELSTILQYINDEKALQIISGILLSVFIAFNIGAFVQWVTRLWLTFNFRNQSVFANASFGGISLASISYFILIKGIKGTSFAERTYSFTRDLSLIGFIESNTVLVAVIAFLFFFLVSLALIVAKLSMYKFIIGAGTFSLALAFAGNDLVNFVGVPLAAYQSFEAWKVSGILPSEFSMEVLSAKVQAPTAFLLASGMIMILTLWFSKKARYVADTQINLSREGEARERFKPNYLSRSVVRITIQFGQYVTRAVPKPLLNRINKQFERPVTKNVVYKNNEQPPAFDVVRASVNMAVAGILISIATSLKLPLSTTYVTFMVAMGTSLADRAWGAESAVYRVAGVLNVIGGWFGTAIIALTSSAVILTLIYFGRGTAIIMLLVAAATIIIRNYLSYNRKMKEEAESFDIKRAESITVKGVINESAKNVENVILRSKSIINLNIEGLSKHDFEALKQGRKEVNSLSEEVEDVRASVFHFIQNLEDSSVKASAFYIQLVNQLNNISQSLEYISKMCYDHVANNHNKLRYTQLRDLREIKEQFERDFFIHTEDSIKNFSAEDITEILDKKDQLENNITAKINAHVTDIRNKDSSPKNTTLYISLLLESKDFLNAVTLLITEYYKSYEESVDSPLKL
ncbi:MAG: inorganic phosphate transporter [Flavobacteriaceae bacterium]|nr:inorganic phosphate transporter [Flavobacteriaceae bacterium]